MTGKSLPYHAVNDSTAWPGVAAPGGGAAGGTVAIDGGTRVGCVSVGGRVGMEPGGARFIAGPDGASGIEPGGTGGGRSENIWAEAGPGASNTKASIEASRSRGKSRHEPPSQPMPLPRQVIAMLFTENAANSSLQSSPGYPLSEEPAPKPDVDPAVVVQS